MYEPRSSLEITRDLVARVVARTPLTDLAETSTLGVLLRSVAEQIAEADVRLAKIRDAFTLKGASGVDLDERAEEIGLTRLGATSASGSVVVSRTDSSAALTIPSGSVFGRGDTATTYATTSPVVMPIGSLDATLPIVANTRGTRGNAPPRAINTIISAPAALVSVVQGVALSNALDEESDAALRVRATGALNSLARAQPVALEYTARTFSASDGTRASTATLYEPPTQAGRCELLIDDGSGIADNPPTRSGEAVSVKLNAVVGQIVGIESPVVSNVRVRANSNVLVEGRDYYVSRSRGVVTLVESSVSVGDTVTVDTYDVYTGLVAELQSEINGDPADITSGHRAAGVVVRVLPAPVQRVSLDVLIVARSATIQTLKAQVESAVVAFLSSLAAGAPAYRATLISTVMSVEGVVNATILTSGTSSEISDIYPNSARGVIRAGVIRAVTSITTGA
jgi:uncharacterized phage protein gp47/JayE